MAMVWHKLGAPKVDFERKEGEKEGGEERKRKGGGRPTGEGKKERKSENTHPV